MLKMRYHCFLSIVIINTTWRCYVQIKMIFKKMLMALVLRHL